MAIDEPILCFFGGPRVPCGRTVFKISHIGIEARIVVVNVFLRDVFFVFLRDNGGDIGDDRVMHLGFHGSGFRVPDKTNLVNTEVDFGDDLGTVFLIGIAKVVARHVGHCRVLVAVDNLLLGSSNDAVDVNKLNLPTLSDKVKS